MKYRVVRQFGSNIDQQREDVYRVETVEMMTQKEAVALMHRLNAADALDAWVNRHLDELPEPPDDRP
jgi:hypothetical protein